MRTAIMSRVLLALGLAVVPSAARAQRGGDQPPAERRRLEREVGAALERQLRERVGLDSAQITRLREVQTRLAPRRRELTQRERQVRGALREQLRSDATADQQRVEGLLDELLRLQRARLDLMDDEQKELRSFMSPVQRARLHAVQEQLRRRMDQMRRRREGDDVRPRR